jgi:putative Ca2+/H+ antiporter (TMEM165/GDT1 family)
MLTAFTAGLLLITISELGDKTFFIAAILAMRHSRRLVFLGVIAALIAMTLLSAMMGQVVSLLPKHYVTFAGVALFIGFGLKLLYDASRMPAKTLCEEVEEAQETIDQSKLTRIAGDGKQQGVVLQSFVLTFLAEWGDRTQFATVTLAASNNAIGVTVGAILGHAICALIAVMCGRLIAGRISEQSVTVIGGGLFILFGIVAAVESV